LTYKRQIQIKADFIFGYDRHKNILLLHKYCLRWVWL